MTRHPSHTRQLLQRRRRRNRSVVNDLNIYHDGKHHGEEVYYLKRAEHRKQAMLLRKAMWST